MRSTPPFGCEMSPPTVTMAEVDCPSDLRFQDCVQEYVLSASPFPGARSPRHKTFSVFDGGTRGHPNRHERHLASQDPARSLDTTDLIHERKRGKEHQCEYRKWNPRKDASVHWDMCNLSEAPWVPFRVSARRIGACPRSSVQSCVTAPCAWSTTVTPAKAVPAQHRS